MLERELPPPPGLDPYEPLTEEEEGVSGFFAMTVLFGIVTIFSMLQLFRRKS